MNRDQVTWLCALSPKNRCPRSWTLVLYPAGSACPLLTTCPQLRDPLQRCWPRGHMNTVPFPVCASHLLLTSLSCAVLHSRGVSYPSLICPVIHSTGTDTGSICSWTGAVCANPTPGPQLLATTPLRVGPLLHRRTSHLFPHSISEEDIFPLYVVFLKSRAGQLSSYSSRMPRTCSWQPGSPCSKPCICHTHLSSPSPDGPTETQALTWTGSGC